MKLGKLAEHYYTAAEARKMLEVDPETFQYWGRDGRIKRVYLPGRKQPVYPKPEINKMAQQTEAFTTVQAEKTDCKAPKNPIKEDKELSKQYYELEDVMRLLRKSRSTVIREANAGKIPTEGPKRNRRYPKEAIDALVEIEESKKRKKEQNVIFSPSTPNDLWQEVAIGRELYGDDDIVPFKTLLQWREINDEMFMSLKYKGNVVGYSSLMPLDED